MDLLSLGEQIHRDLILSLRGPNRGKLTQSS